MLLPLDNTPRDYAWGSRTAIAEVLGRQASGGPEAELWFGAHPESPARVKRESPRFGGLGLDRVVAEDPAVLLGPGRDRMPFLLKLLAAERPLSLQVHPDAAQAREGFAREERSGPGRDDPARNYRDDQPKPEMLLALSPTFEALAGFRHVSEARMLLAELATFADADGRAAIAGLSDRLASGDPAAAGSTGSSRHVIFDGVPDEAETAPEHDGAGNPLEAAVEHLLRRGPGVDELVGAVVDAAGRASANSSFGREWETVARLAETNPGDPGIVLSLLLNRISLQAGQAMSLEAGVLHAYLQGTGVELMSSSDNVLRGGLTGKHVDVDELLRVVRFETVPVPRIAPDSPTPGITVWQPAEGGFLLGQIALGDAAEVHGYALAGPEQAAFDLSGPAVLLVIDGALQVAGRRSDAPMARGDALLATPDEGTLTISGSGIAFVATTP